MNVPMDAVTFRPEQMISRQRCHRRASKTEWKSEWVRNSGAGMYPMHAHACDVAFMQTLECMLAMVIKSGCISRSPVILVTGALSDARMMGTIVVPSGN